MPNVLDDFEGGSLPSAYGGDTGQWEVNTEFPFNGSYAAHTILSDNGAGGGHYAIVRDSPTLGVGDTPISSYIRDEGSVNAEMGIIFGAQSVTGGSSLSGYVAWVDFAGSYYGIRRFDSGSVTSLASYSTSKTSDKTYYELVLTQWKSDGTITVEIQDTSGNVVDTMNAVDTNYQSGLIGLHAYRHEAKFSSAYPHGYYDDVTTPNLLSPPSNVHFNDTTTEDQLTLDWDTSGTGASGYYVYRAQSSGSTKSDYTQVANVTGPPYTDTSLEDGERYYYRVSSHD